MSDARAFPERPFLAVSAAIIRDGRVLLVRRARRPAKGLYTLPGGVVELGETLIEAVCREVREETGAEIEALRLVGYREAILRGADQRIERHFVILPFAARWIAREPEPIVEIDEVRWVEPGDVAALPTTEGLAAIVDAAVVALS